MIRFQFQRWLNFLSVHTRFFCPVLTRNVMWFHVRQQRFRLNTHWWFNICYAVSRNLCNTFKIVCSVSRLLIPKNHVLREKKLSTKKLKTSSLVFVHPHAFQSNFDFRFTFHLKVLTEQRAAVIYGFSLFRMFLWIFEMRHFVCKKKFAFHKNDALLYTNKNSVIRYKVCYVCGEPNSHFNTACIFNHFTPKTMECLLVNPLKYLSSYEKHVFTEFHWNSLSIHLSTSPLTVHLV